MGCRTPQIVIVPPAAYRHVALPLPRKLLEVPLTRVTMGHNSLCEEHLS